MSNYVPYKNDRCNNLSIPVPQINYGIKKAADDKSRV